MNYSTGPIRLSAALCDAHGRLSMASLETRLIVAATCHADALGVGYRDLARDGNAWVLSRMSIQMDSMPGILDTFSIETWVESFNRHLSQRNFAVLDASGAAIGYARSLWTCINIASRRPARLCPVTEAITVRDCPIEPMPRLTDIDTPDRVVPIEFRYSDIDFNRHVNSVRYLCHIADAFPLSWHDAHRVRRLDISYVREARYGSPAELRLLTTQDGLIRADIAAPGEDAYCRARLFTVPRQ